MAAYGMGKQETEWDRVQRKYGNLPPAETAITEEQLETLVCAVAETHDPLENKTLDELDELEDDEDDDILMQYRMKRMEEMRAESARPSWGALCDLQSNEFISEVSKAPKDVYVILLLDMMDQTESKVMAEALRYLAKRHTTTKFARMKATDCIPNYPERNVPTLLIYRNGDVVTQFISLKPFGGVRMTPDDVEWALAQARVLETELEEDPRGAQRDRVFVNVMQSRSGRQ